MCVHACVHACVHLSTFSLKKSSPQKLLTGLLPNFIVLFLRYRLKSSLHRYRKIRPVERYRRSSASSSFLSRHIVCRGDQKHVRPVLSQTASYKTLILICDVGEVAYIRKLGCLNTKVM